MKWIDVSKDEDFLSLAIRPFDCGRLVWLRIGNCRKQTLLQRWSLLWPDILRKLQAGQRIIEIR